MSARDELALVLANAQRFRNGSSALPSADHVSRLALDDADAVLAAGYRKQPEPVIEWGVGNKWGRHAKASRQAAVDYIEWAKQYPADNNHLVKRIAASEPGPWEPVQ